MRKAIDETNRRREIQLKYNEEHGVVPKGIVKSLEEVRMSTSVADARRVEGADVVFDGDLPTEELAKALEEEMLREATELNFEKAASLRDRLDDVRIQLAVEREQSKGRRRRGRGRS
jgi:excinuclease ABC subunit B